MKRISGIFGMIAGTIFFFMCTLVTLQALLMNETADFWVGFFMSLLTMHYTANSIMLSISDE